MRYDPSLRDTARDARLLYHTRYALSTPFLQKNWHLVLHAGSVRRRYVPGFLPRMRSCGNSFPGAPGIDPYTLSCSRSACRGRFFILWNRAERVCREPPSPLWRGCRARYIRAEFPCPAALREAFHTGCRGGFCSLKLYHSTSELSLFFKRFRIIYHFSRRGQKIPSKTVHNRRLRANFIRPTP